MKNDQFNYKFAAYLNILPIINSLDICILCLNQTQHKAANQCNPRHDQQDAYHNTTSACEQPQKSCQNTSSKPVAFNAYTNYKSTKVLTPVYTGSKPQTRNIMRRNLHQQALQGFYLSQSCYFTLNNYTNHRPYQMQVRFSQLSNHSQPDESVIFVYKFSTYAIVKSYNENGVGRLTHTVTKDFETQFYVDFYVHNDSIRLQEKVRSDSNKQILRKKHLWEINNQLTQIQSQIMRSSMVQSNYSASKSRHRPASTNRYSGSSNNNFAGFDSDIRMSSMPLYHQHILSRRLKSTSLNGSFMQNASSQRLRNTKRIQNRQCLLLEKQGSNSNSKNRRAFQKKYPITKMSDCDLSRKEIKSRGKQANFVTPPKQSLHLSPKSHQRKSFLNADKKQIAQQLTEHTENSSKQVGRKFTFDLKLFLSVKDLSLDDILTSLRRNVLIVVFISVVFFIVVSKAFDNDNSKNFVRSARRSYGNARNRKNINPEEQENDDYQDEVFMKGRDSKYSQKKNHPRSKLNNKRKIEQNNKNDKLDSISENKMKKAKDKSQVKSKSLKNF